MKGKILISTITIISCLVLAIPVQAGILGAGLGGALHGAIAGDLIDGRSRAPEGAVIGGLIGAGEAASSEKKQEQPNDAALKRKAEWEASEKAEQERIRQQNAGDQPKKTAENTKLDQR
jgi:hypothetical protein